MGKPKTETQVTEQKNTNEHMDTAHAPFENPAQAAAKGALSETPPALPRSPLATQGENALLPLADLAQRHRVPTWQQAALHTLMGWEDGKLVTDAEYQTGLARLSGRRMGGM